MNSLSNKHLSQKDSKLNNWTSDYTLKVKEEYPLQYCQMLESAYGSGMLSEGGTKAIDAMLDGVSLAQRKALEIGFGLGAVAFYLASKYQMQIDGVELVEWMPEYAKNKTPPEIAHLVNFHTYDPYPKIPIFDKSCDLVFSKGVLVHVPADKKQAVFDEIARVVKFAGDLVIDDWLSEHEDRFGAKIEELCRSEDLSLFPETEESYTKTLQKSGFSIVSIDNRNDEYRQYNLDIVNKLKGEEGVEFVAKFGQGNLDEIMKGHQNIADAINQGELLIRRIRAKKL